MVDDLLGVSRFERGAIELRRKRVDLADVVLEAAEVARPLCDRLQHRFSVTLPTQPIYIDADASRLSQVLGTLLNNACTFTPAGGGHVELTVERDAAHAVLRVRDNGVGIAADQLPHIFEMFVQVDMLERSASGLGIRLTLVRTLAELHGGTLHAASAGIGCGSGSEFVIRLPALQASVQADPGAPASTVQQHSPPAPRRILVVDDNRDATDALALLLQLDGHEIRAVYDGLEALDVAQSFQPEIVLLDIGLPGLSGCEVARRLRLAPRAAALLRPPLAAEAPADRRWAAAALRAAVRRSAVEGRLAAAAPAARERAPGWAAKGSARGS